MHSTYTPMMANYSWCSTGFYTQFTDTFRFVPLLVRSILVEDDFLGIMKWLVLVNYSWTGDSYFRCLSSPGGPSKSTARGLFVSNLHRVPRAILSYTSGLLRANNIVSSISLQDWNQKVKTVKEFLNLTCKEMKSNREQWNNPNVHIKFWRTLR